MQASSRPSGASFSLGKGYGKGDSARQGVARAGTSSPGPGYYEAANTAFGAQRTSNRASVPAHSMGARSARKVAADGSPGPGYYDAPGAFGKATNSQRVSAGGD